MPGVPNRDRKSRNRRRVVAHPSSQTQPTTMAVTEHALIMTRYIFVLWPARRVESKPITQEKEAIERIVPAANAAR